jgi:SAM-dependent methyltransferase
MQAKSGKMREKKTVGDSHSFDQMWRTRAEAHYNHWTLGRPINQIQLAFRRHWLLFSELLDGSVDNLDVLEVGCGRGSALAYFAENGATCTGIDLSQEAILIAGEIFRRNGLAAKFEVGDAQDLPYESGSFDITVSIGLLEHFEDITPALSEQVRVLRPEGMFLGYVVPEYGDNVQSEFAWVNSVLRGCIETDSSHVTKSKLFRSDAGSASYLSVLRELGLNNPRACGVYPLPMVSHSPEFPFSLLPQDAELALVEYFERVLESRKSSTNLNPWVCGEGYGQAFLIWGRKG